MGGTEFQSLITFPFHRLHPRRRSGRPRDRALQRRHADPPKPTMAASSPGRSAVRTRRTIAGGDAATRRATSKGTDGSIFTTELRCAPPCTVKTFRAGSSGERSGREPEIRKNRRHRFLTSSPAPGRTDSAFQPGRLDTCRRTGWAPTPRDRPGPKSSTRADLVTMPAPSCHAQNRKARHRDVARHQVMVGQRISAAPSGS